MGELQMPGELLRKQTPWSGDGKVSALLRDTVLELRLEGCVGLNTQHLIDILIWVGTLLDYSS